MEQKLSNLSHKTAGIAAGLILTVAAAGEPGQVPAGVFNVRQYAIEACAAAGSGQVLFPAGRYLTGTLHLKSHVTLFLEAGARVVGTPDLEQYQQPTVPSFMPEARWGKWHRALILGEGLAPALQARA